MNAHNIDQDAVKRLNTHFFQVLSQGNYEKVDVAFALAEFIGRFVVDIAPNPVQGTELLVAMEEQSKRTLMAGYSSKGFNMGEGGVQ